VCFGIKVEGDWLYASRGLWTVDKAKINQEMEVKDEELLLFKACEA
jgi:hypothetical protein